jgi:hypothetical protein
MATAKESLREKVDRLSEEEARKVLDLIAAKELHRIGPREFQEKCRIDFEVIIEGLSTEWSELQARRLGKDVCGVERKLAATARPDAA